MIYHNGFIVIVQNRSVRCVEIAASEVTLPVEHFMTIDHGVNIPKNDNQVLEGKEFTGLLSSERVFQLVYNHLRDEVVCVCVDANNKLVYFKVELNKGMTTGLLKLEQYKPADYSSIPVPKFVRPKAESLNSEPVQVHYLAFNNVPYLLIVRQNQHYEVVRNFSETILIDT
jgi:hypothetical protein